MGKGSLLIQTSYTNTSGPKLGHVDDNLHKFKNSHMLTMTFVNLRGHHLCPLDHGSIFM